MAASKSTKKDIRKQILLRIPLPTWNKLHQIAFDLGEKEKRQYNFTATMVRLIEDRYTQMNRASK
jgi:hypothetical protein